MEKVIEIPKLNEIFALAVNICRYCGGTCEMSMRECNGARRLRKRILPQSSLETYPYSECPSCKQTMRAKLVGQKILSDRLRGYRVPQSFGEATSPKAARGMLWIWREEQT